MNDAERLRMPIEDLLQLPTSIGLAEATREPHGTSWLIKLPWRKQTTTFEGTRMACRNELLNAIAAYELAKCPGRSEVWQFIGFIDRVCERFGMSHVVIAERPQVGTRDREPIVACGAATWKMNWTPRWKLDQRPDASICPKCEKVMKANQQFPKSFDLHDPLTFRRCCHLGGALHCVIADDVEGAGYLFLPSCTRHEIRRIAYDWKKHGHPKLITHHYGYSNETKTTEPLKSTTTGSSDAALDCG